MSDAAATDRRYTFPPLDENAAPPPTPPTQVKGRDVAAVPTSATMRLAAKVGKIVAFHAREAIAELQENADVVFARETRDALEEAAALAAVVMMLRDRGKINGEIAKGMGGIVVALRAADQLDMLETIAQGAAQKHRVELARALAEIDGAEQSQ